MRSFRLVLEFEWRSLLSSKSFLIQLVALEPLAYLMLLGAGLSGVVANAGPSYLTYIYPGIIGFQILRLFSYMIYRLTLERRWGLLAIKVVGGVSRISYLMAMLTLPLMLFLLELLVSAPMASLLGVTLDMTKLTSLVLTGAISILFWVSLAMLFSFSFRSYAQRDMLLTFLMLPLSLSAPVFYSLDRAPHYLQIISQFNPLTYQVQSMRAMFLGEPVALGLWVSLAISAMMLAAATTLICRCELLASEG